MFKNMLRVALRNFYRDKWYSLLNILGLTIGITFSVFLVFYIKDELSYDRYHEKADRICRINAYVKEPEKDTMKWAITPFPMAAALSKDYPEVEAAVRLWDNGKPCLRAAANAFMKTRYSMQTATCSGCLPINLLRATRRHP